MATEPIQTGATPETRERDARIDQILADIEQKLATTVKIKQDTRYAPWTVLTAALGAGAALFAAGAAFMKVFLG